MRDSYPLRDDCRDHLLVLPERAEDLAEECVEIALAQGGGPGDRFASEAQERLGTAGTIRLGYRAKEKSLVRTGKSGVGASR